MIDQSHNIEGKIEAMIQSVVNIQTAFAKRSSLTATRCDRLKLPETSWARTES